MSGRSPGQRLRSKTADLSEFLRGNSHESRRTDEHAIPTIPVPQVPEAESPHKNKRRLLFLGRKRKSGGVTPNSSPIQSPTRKPPSDTTEIPPAHHTNRSVANLKSRASGSPGSKSNVRNDAEERPNASTLPSRLPPLNVSPPSLGALTAQFNPSQTNLTFSSNYEKPLPNPDRYQSALLSRPSTSFDSVRYNDRTPTPRPTRPTIAISPPHDALITADARDVYMSPRSAPSPPAVSFWASGRSGFDPYVSEHEKLSAQSSVESASGSSSSFASSIDQDRRLVSYSSVDLRSGLISGVDSLGDRSKNVAATLSSFDTSERPVPRNRSGFRSISPIGAPTAPPNIPLPILPLSASSDSAVSSFYNNSYQMPSIPSLASQQDFPYRADSQRPRAYTTCSLPPNVIRSSGRSGRSGNVDLTSRPSVPPIWHRKKKHFIQIPRNIRDENVDIDDHRSATREQLREALTLQRVKIDDLSEYLLEVVGNHEAEKALLERRIEFLENEARKREKEIRGLRYLVMNAGVPVGGDHRVPSDIDFVRTSTRSPGAETLEGLSLLQQSSPSLFRAVSAVQDGERSEPQSPNTVHPGSKALKRSNSNTLSHDDTTGQMVTVPYSQASSLRSPTISITDSTDSGGPTGLGIDLPSQVSNRPSMNSLSTTSSSSTSSLPSLTAMNTASTGLSAIPESPAPYIDPASPDPYISEKQREKEERRASRTLKRLSASSAASSTGALPAAAAASAAYASNLRKGKARSIEQVIEQYPNTRELLQRLKSLGD